MKTTIEIPEPLYKKAKIRAVETGQTLRQIVLRSLERELEGPPTVAEAGSSYWANRKLHPDFERLMKSGALAPKPGDRSIDEIVADVKADPEP